MHDAPQDVLVDAYPEEEYWQDLLKVTGGITNEAAGAPGDPRLVATAATGCASTACISSRRCRARCMWRAPTPSSWAAARRWSMPTTAAPKQLGVQIRYDAPVDAHRTGRRPLRRGPHRRASASRRAACVLAAGGFESNREWLREAWGQNERGEWPADNFLIRGTRFNKGVLLKHMIDAGADIIGDPSQSHCVAIDARAPLYDGGICTRIDCVSLGVVVNREAQRFYDEGEDFWPKRYAIWGRLVAQQPGQIAYSIIDAKAIGRFMPPVFPGTQGRHAARARAASSGWTSAAFMQHRRRLQRGLPRRHLRPHGARRLPHRRARRRPRRTGRGRSTPPPFFGYRAAARHHLHLPGPEGRRTRGGALRRSSPATTCSWRAK